MTRIGCAYKSNDQEKTTIESRFRTRQWGEENLKKDVIRLYFNNKDVEEYDEKAIPLNLTSETHIAGDFYTGYTTEAERRKALDTIYGMKCQETGNLPYKITLTGDYPYIPTVNIDVEDGSVNGTIKKLRHVEDEVSQRATFCRFSC